MTALADRLSALIAASGPLPVSAFMAACLFDPAHGYYTTREPFGPAGDFITAPEISQMFGELLGAWLVSRWRAGGSPLPATVAEIGPGRGTLMKDLLRTLPRLAPALADAAEVRLVEASPRLVAVQRATLAGASARLAWQAELDGLPDAPLFLVANELLDAIPVRQFVRVAGAWRERAVGLDAAGRLAFVAGAGTLDPALLPSGAAAAPEGAVFETAPAREALVADLSRRLAAHGGAALLVDYGHLEPGLGDTLQAVRRHRREPVLASPGEADLTAHVDFSALAAIARTAGLSVRLSTQGDFLLAAGLLERAGRLGAAADEAVRVRLTAAVERLAGPAAMGTLFKVMELVAPPAASARSGPATPP